MEHVTVGDFQGLQNGTGTLSLITNDQGGIVDDTVTTRVSLLNPVQSTGLQCVAQSGCVVLHTVPIKQPSALLLCSRPH